MCRCLVDMSDNIVEEWLRSLTLAKYTQAFLDNGYDDLEICKQIGQPDLDAIGVVVPHHRKDILKAVKNLRELGGTAVYFTLEEPKNYDDYDELLTPKSYFNTPVHERIATFSAGAFARKKLDEYEEGKKSLISYSKIQLTIMIKEKLLSEGTDLSKPPYSNPDGSRGNIDVVTHRYAEEFRTHYHEVREILEDVRLQKWLLKDHEGYQKSIVLISDVSPGPHKPLLHSPSPSLDDTGSGSGSEDSDTKKKGTLARLLNTLKRPKKNRPPIPTYRQHEGDLQAQEITMCDEELSNIQLAVKEGKLSQEQAVSRVKQYENKVRKESLSSAEMNPESNYSPRKISKSSLSSTDTDIETSSVSGLITDPNIFDLTVYSPYVIKEFENSSQTFRKTSVNSTVSSGGRWTSTGHTSSGEESLREHSSQEDSSPTDTIDQGTLKNDGFAGEEIVEEDVIIGTAVAKADFVPSPYDHEALKLKKGDIVNIIRKNPSGIWRGMVDGKIGNFKFVCVNEISNTVDKQHSPLSDISSLRSRVRLSQPLTLDEVLRKIGLLDLKDILQFHGYDDMDTFSELTAETLALVEVTHEQKTKLLTAAQLLRDNDLGSHVSCEQMSDTSSIAPSLSPSPSPSYRNDSEVRGNRDSGIVKTDEDLADDHVFTPTNGCPDAGGGEGNCIDLLMMNQKLIVEAELHNFTPVSPTFDPTLACDITEKQCLLDNKMSIPTLVRDSLRTPSFLTADNFDASIGKYRSHSTSSSPSSSRVPPKLLPKPTKRVSTVLSGRCNSFTLDYRPVKSQSFELPRNPSQKQYYSPQTQHRNAKDYLTLETHSGSTNPEPKRTIFNANLRQRNFSQGCNNSTKLRSQHGRQSSLPSVVSCKGSNGSPHSQRNSCSLDFLVASKLVQEDIDLTVKPYTSEHGVCGIPPPLVERYSEELQHPILDIMSCMESVRISQLRRAGKIFVPNESCSLFGQRSLFDGCPQTISSLLTHIGLPMYANTIEAYGCHTVEHFRSLKDSDFKHIGIKDSSHIRKLLSVCELLRFQSDTNFQTVDNCREMCDRV